MRVAVPAEGPETTALSANVLGRCPFFVLADTETRPLDGTTVADALDPLFEVTSS